MKFMPILCHRNAQRWLPAAIAALLVTFVVGCASPGPPQPPSLNLPETVKDLTAGRVGDVVNLRWTTPTSTTDHLDVKGAMTAQICRVAVSSAPPPYVCIPVTQLTVHPGSSQATETLPQPLTTGSTALITYRIQIFNAQGRSAGPSPEAFAVAGAAPPPVDQLRATPTRDGAMLQWQPKDTSAAVELDRLPIGPDGVVIQPTPPKAAKSSKPPIKKQADKPQKPAPPKPVSAPASKPLQLAPPTPIEVKLRAPSQSSDAGGTIDHTAQMGESYRYTAQRVQSLSLTGHTLELRSVVSPPVTVEMRNTFPPHAPSGLEAVPGGATAADRSIDLSWAPNTDPDLAGYFVYRQDIDSKGVAAGTATRLNPTPVVGPAYRDQTATAGRRYSYRVTAVDTAGNESAPSEAVQETLREQ
jgi:hypothetical protein